MSLTGRAAVLALLGVLPVALAPGWSSLLGWLLVLALAIGLDLALAGSARGLTVHREPVPTVRLGESVESTLVIASPSMRTRNRSHCSRTIIAIASCSSSARRLTMPS